MNDVMQKIDMAKNEIISTVQQTMESLVTRTISVIKSDFDTKILHLQNSIRPTSVVSKNFSFSLVCTIEQLQELDSKLEDHLYTENVKKYMMDKISNVADTVNGQNTCYELVDHFFDRKLMLKCSWTGASKNENPKCALRLYKNVLNTFFEIVKGINSSFNVKLMEHFFKSVTRNSKKRCEAKGLRCSTVHRRSKKKITSVAITLVEY
ncbi:uncharacterized protein LOC129719673 [Wyeomyia smithii]|uniref:uncharacterized protein LOC129719673 n=1 Tax=Wyeomyia smithii TaxID=174621 RepID=UPI002467BB65|nr:uncharacterized protein LOC129719673 [Wyeomyia smithii]